MESGDVIALYSADGQNLWNDTAIRQTLLVRIFSKQRAMGYCGVQTAGLLMSARYFGKKYPDEREQTLCDVSDVPYRDTNLFSFPETTNVLDEERVREVGATLKQLHDLFRSFEIPARRIHADDSNVDEFRSLAMAALSHTDSSQGVVVNYEYHWKQGEEVIKVGHFSPLAAYHQQSDRFLLLDTWLDGQEEWVKTEDIFKQMNGVDPDASIRRGYIITGCMSTCSRC
ncbi:uncharacterized protein [Diadema antillarum]|uniref:uncharacterized protein n=1 Tax=Diadema antillarum TaxID=105358 RepID=UPI003A87AFB0